MKRSGFTLLELILSTAIAAMMALALYSAMNTGFKARNSARSQMADIQSLTITMDLIQRDLESIIVPGQWLSGPFDGHAMGSPGRETDSLDFYCLGRDRDITSQLSEGFRRIKFTLQTDGSGAVLIRNVTRNLLASPIPEPDTEVLSRDIVGFSVRFYDGSTWRSEWDSLLQQDILPFAIEVTLRKQAVRDRSATEPYSITRIITLPCAAAAEPETTDAQ